MSINKLFASIAALLLLAPFAAIANAQTKVAIIDQAQIMGESKAGKDISQKLRNIAEQINKEMKPDADWLKREGESLETKTKPMNRQAILGDQALVARIKTFDDRQKGFVAKSQTRAAELELTRRKAWADFFQALAPALQAVIDENQAEVVLDKNAVIHVADSVDLTSQVIAKLDTSTPTITVTKQSLPKKTQ